MILPALAVAVTATLCGCVQKAENSERAEARALYEESLALIDRYTDSVSAAKDSATLNGLMTRYQEEIGDLNFRHVPEASYAISEGENDTLTTRTLRLVNLADSLLYRYAHPLVLRADSLPKDTISSADSSRSGSSRRIGGRSVGR